MSRASFNSVTLMGTLGADPELRYTAEGAALATFNIAVDEGKDQTNWFSIVAWKKTAELCAQYLAKGRQVLVQGRLKNRSWETPDGQKRFKTEIIANSVTFIGGDRQQNGNGNGGEQRHPADDGDDGPFAGDHTDQIPFE